MKMKLASLAAALSLGTLLLLGEAPVLAAPAAVKPAPASKQTAVAAAMSPASPVAKQASGTSLAAAEIKLFGSKAASLLSQEKWALLPATALQGDAVMIRSQVKGTVWWQNRIYPLTSFGSGYYTFLPVSATAKPGKYKIGTATLTIKAKTFSVQRLKVTKEQEAMQRNQKRIDQDQAKIDKARSKSAGKFLFTGSFLQPVKGRLSTPFGYTRYVNGKLASSHMAIDLAVPVGTPVKATNDGVVLLSDSLYLTGNTVYIDHGLNVVSQYAHLSKLLVKPGDKVKAGQTIGLAGSTGFSTGPHLHFAMWVENKAVNPNIFFNTTPFAWDHNHE